MPKRSSIAITKQRVDLLKAGQQIWDSSVVGFGVIANAHSKSYKLKYRFRGTQRMLTIGIHGSPFTVDAARKKAQAYLTQLHAGSDPAEEKANLALTVEALCAEYMEKHANVQKKATSAHQDAMNIRNHVTPLLGKIPVADVTAKHIDDFKLKVQSGKTAPSNPKQGPTGPKRWLTGEGRQGCRQPLSCPVVQDVQSGRVVGLSPAKFQPNSWYFEVP